MKTTLILYLCLHLLHALYSIVKNTTWKDPSRVCEDTPPPTEWKSPGNSAQLWQKRQTPFWTVQRATFTFPPQISVIQWFPSHRVKMCQKMAVSITVSGCCMHMVRSQYQVSASSPPHFPRQGQSLSLNLELSNWVRLAGYESSGILLSRPPQCWGYRYLPSCLGFLCGCTG